MRRDANAKDSQFDYSLSSLNEASRLRQKAPKSWQYLIANEVVYRVKGDKTHPLAGMGYLEQYLTSDAWFEVVLFPLGHSYAARAILEHLNLPRRTSERRYDLAAGDLYIDPVLIGIPQPIEDREGMAVGIPTVCWLEFCNLRDGIRQNVYCQLPEAANASLCKVEDQGEGRAVVGLASRAGEVAESKIPSHVIQRRTEIMNNITEDRPQRNWRRAMRRNLVKDIIKVLRIEMSSELIRVSIKEGPSLPFEFVKVFARPFNLEPGPCNVAVHGIESTGDHTLHEVHPHHERQRTTETEDPERTRNCRPLARGVAWRSQEGGQGQALNPDAT
jgi:hypothetical protein